MGDQYSPAAWGDAEGDRPLNAYLDMTGTGLSNAYSVMVENVITKAVDEMKQKHNSNIPFGWKKRLRDFMATKHEKLLDCIQLSTSSHPTISRLDHLFQKFGVTNFHPAAGSVKMIVADMSGSDMVAELNQELYAIHRETPLETHTEQTKFMFEKYREVADKILELESEILAKLQTFDRLQGKLVALFEIEHNENYDAMMESVEKYLGTIFERNNFEKSYKALLETYRRFISLREIILMARSRDLIEKEPLCSICLQESVAFAVVPCGHTFCGICSKRQAANCYICRGTVKEKIKLFFG